MARSLVVCQSVMLPLQSYQMRIPTQNVANVANRVFCRKYAYFMRFQNVVENVVNVVGYPRAVFIVKKCALYPFPKCSRKCSTRSGRVYAYFLYYILLLHFRSPNLCIFTAKNNHWTSYYIYYILVCMASLV